MSLASRVSRTVSVSVAVLLAAGFVAACGGSDAPSKEDFIAEAAQICADYNADAKQAQAEFQTAIEAGDLEGAAQLFEENAAAINEGIDEIEAIGLPEGDEETIEGWFELGRQQADVAAEMADASAADDGQALDAALEEGNQIQEEADAIADEYGMVDCGSAGNNA
jgi:hypothetical protein